MQDNVSALSQMGITNDPIGTKDEVLAIGMDIAETACCAPRQRGIQRGCALWNQCRFHQPKMGGFKGQGGPRYIGYRMITDEGTANENDVKCHVWVRSIQARADHGANMIRQGKNGERINIVAQEGEEIITRIAVPVNARGQIVSVSQDQFDLLEAHGHKVNRDERNTTYDFVNIKLKHKVARHPRPGELSGVSYEQELMQREKERLALEGLVEAEVHARSREKLDDKVERFAPVVEPGGSTFEIEETPVKGRKAKNDEDG